MATGEVLLDIVEDTMGSTCVLVVNGRLLYKSDIQEREEHELGSNKTERWEMLFTSFSRATDKDIEELKFQVEEIPMHHRFYYL